MLIERFEKANRLQAFLEEAFSSIKGSAEALIWVVPKYDGAPIPVDSDRDLLASELEGCIDQASPSPDLTLPNMQLLGKYLLSITLRKNNGVTGVQVAPPGAAQSRTE